MSYYKTTLTVNVFTKDAPLDTDYYSLNDIGYAIEDGQFIGNSKVDSVVLLDSTEVVAELKAGDPGLTDADILRAEFWDR